MFLDFDFKINLDVSKAVTKEEWADVYNESLKLIEVFPLAELEEKIFYSVKTPCLTRTKEREVDGWEQKKTRLCWSACGDMVNLRCADTFHFSKELRPGYDPSVGDAAWALLSRRNECGLDEQYAEKTFDMGVITQKYRYHWYLLSVACMVEDRLKEKAVVTGDIELSEIKEAVKMANSILKVPVSLPSCCDMNRFYERVSRLDATELEKLQVFNRFYIGNITSEYLNFVRQKFPDETCSKYIQDEIQPYVSNSKYKKYKEDSSMEAENEKYDIYGYGHLPCYKKGDSIKPKLLKSIMAKFALMRSTLKENHFEEYMQLSASARCRCIAYQNKSLLIRDTDWERIFNDIKTNRQSFERYYPAIRISPSCGAVINFLEAVVLNDDFYAFLCDSIRD